MVEILTVKAVTVKYSSVIVMHYVGTKHLMKFIPLQECMDQIRQCFVYVASALMLVKAELRVLVTGIHWAE
jgi:hypothetical protein